jgi:hypothetical protein
MQDDDTVNAIDPDTGEWSYDLWFYDRMYKRYDAGEIGEEVLDCKPGNTGEC